MDIRIANTDTEINTCYTVMHELRPHLDETEFVSRVRTQQQAGYQLAYLQEAGSPVAVAGFRLGESLAWGKYLYVDDLATASNQRSRGFGAALLLWLTDFARAEGCDQLHLDSGVHRKDAHRFYEREGMQLASYHYAMAISDKMPG